MEWVTGVKVEVRKTNKGYDFFENKEKRKSYEDQLGSKLEQQPFPGNGARKLVGYFNNVNKSASTRIPS